ncbi:MAG: hypothetical protein MUP47_07700 [Phycisphaerae bacterium]|nr:hypothetical protein [Phycisphaerae bacterium]
MELNERQSERIALWLDGRDVDLTAEELTAAQRLRRREAMLGGLLDVQMPPEVGPRAIRALRRELGWRRRRVLRIVVDVAAVAAAAVLIVALLLPEGVSAPPTAVPTTVLFEDAYRGARAVELDAIADQIDQVEARIVAALPPVPEEGLAETTADDEAGKVFDDPWLEELLQNLSS